MNYDGYKQPNEDRIVRLAHAIVCECAVVVELLSAAIAAMAVVAGRCHSYFTLLTIFFFYSWGLKGALLQPGVRRVAEELEVLYKQAYERSLDKRHEHR